MYLFETERERESSHKQGQRETQSPHQTGSLMGVGRLDPKTLGS